MKRPMLCCGCAALIISVLAIGLKSELLCAVIALLLAASAVMVFFGRFRFYVPILLLLSLIAFCAVSRIGDVRFASSLEGEIETSGVICEVKGNDKSVGYTVKADKVNGQKVNFKIRIISIYGLQYETGDRVTVNVELFDENTTLHDRANGVYRSGFLSDVLSHEEETNFYSTLASVRRFVAGKLFSRLSSPEASLLTALTLGDKSYISASLAENVRRSGVSHVIVVSGLHLGIITGAFLTFARRVRLGNKIIGSVGLLFIFLVCAITGFTVSALRAGLAYIIIFIGYLFNRRPDSLNSLFCAATLITLINPFVASSVSFQLSFSATFGIIVVSPRVMARLNANIGTGVIDRLFGKIMPVCVTTVCATVLTLPFIIYHFGTVSLVAFATNMLITYAVTASLICTVSAVLLSGIGGVYNLLLLLAGLFSKFIIFTVNSLGNLPFAEYTFKNTFLATVIASAIAITLSVYSLNKYDLED